MIPELQFVGGPLDGADAIDVGRRVHHVVNGGVRWIYLPSTDRAVCHDGVVRTLWRLAAQYPAGAILHPALDLDPGDQS